MEALNIVERLRCPRLVSSIVAGKELRSWSPVHPELGQFLRRFGNDFSKVRRSSARGYGTLFGKVRRAHVRTEIDRLQASMPLVQASPTRKNHRDSSGARSIFSG